MKRGTIGLLLALGSAISAADLSGRWTLTLDPDFSGNPDTHDCTLKQVDTKLTSECDGGPPISGDVKDEHVTPQFKTGDLQEAIESKKPDGLARSLRAPRHANLSQASRYLHATKMGSRSPCGGSTPCVANTRQNADARGAADYQPRGK